MSASVSLSNLLRLASEPIECFPDRTLARAAMGQRILGALCVARAAWYGPSVPQAAALRECYRNAFSGRLTPSAWSFLLDSSLQTLTALDDHWFGGLALLRYPQDSLRERPVHRWLTGYESSLRHHGANGVSEGVEQRAAQGVRGLLKLIALSASEFCASRLQGEGTETRLALKNASFATFPLVERHGDEIWLLDGMAPGAGERVVPRKWCALVPDGDGEPFSVFERTRTADATPSKLSILMESREPSNCLIPWTVEKEIVRGVHIVSRRDLATWPWKDSGSNTSRAVVSIDLEPGEDPEYALRSRLGAIPTEKPYVVLTGPHILPLHRDRIAPHVADLAIVTTPRAARFWPPDTHWVTESSVEDEHEVVDDATHRVVSAILCGQRDPLHIWGRGGSDAAVLAHAFATGALSVTTDGSVVGPGGKLTTSEAARIRHQTATPSTLMTASSPVDILFELDSRFRSFAADAGDVRDLAAYDVVDWCVRLSALLRLHLAADTSSSRSITVRSPRSLTEWFEIAMHRGLAEPFVVDRKTVKLIRPMVLLVQQARRSLHAGASFEHSVGRLDLAVQTVVLAMEPWLSDRAQGLAELESGGLLVRTGDFVLALDTFDEESAQFVGWGRSGRVVQRRPVGDCGKVLRRLAARLATTRERIEVDQLVPVSHEVNLVRALRTSSAAARLACDLVDREDSVASTLRNASADVVALVGPSGVGKTTELRRWVADGPAEALRTVVHGSHLLAPGDLLTAIVAACTVSPRLRGRVPADQHAALALRLRQFGAHRIAVDGIDEAAQADRAIEVLVHDLALLHDAGGATEVPRTVVTMRSEARALLDSAPFKVGVVPVGPLGRDASEALWRLLSPEASVAPSVDDRAFFEPTPAEVAVRRTPRMARFAASSGSSRLSSIDDLVSSWLIRELPDELSRLLLGRIALAAWSTRSTGLTPSSVAMIDPELSDCLLSEDGLRCIATLVQRGFIRVTGDVYAVAIDDVLEHLVGRIAVRELLGMGVDKLLEELRGRNAPALAAGTARAIGRIAIEDKRDLECLATRLASSMDSVSLRDIELLCQGISSVKSSDASCWILSVWSLRPKFALTRNRRQAIRAQEDILIRLAAYHGEETILTEALLGSPHLRDHAAAQLAISSRHRFRAVGTVLDGSVARVHWRRPWTLAPAVAVAFCLFATLMFVEPRARGEYLRIARQLGVNLGVLGAGSRLRSGILAFVVGSVLPRLDAWPQGPVPMLSEFKRLFDGGSGNRACLRPIQRLYEGTVGPNEVEDTIRALATDLSMAPMLVAERAMLSVLSGKWAQDMLDVAQRVGDQVLPANGDDPMILTPPTMGGQSMLYVYWSYLQNNPPSTPGWIDRYEEFRLLHDRWLLHIGHAQWHYRYCSATPGARHKSIYLVPRLVLGSKAGDETRMLVLHELWRRSEFDDQLVLDLLDEIRIVAVGEHEVSMALDALEPLFVSGADRWKHRPILRRCVSQLIAELLVRDELSTRQALRRHGLGSLLNGLPGPRPMEELGYALYLATDRRLAMEAERGSALHLFLELVLSQVFEARSFREYVNWLIQALVRALEERG